MGIQSISLFWQFPLYTNDDFEDEKLCRELPYDIQEVIDQEGDQANAAGPWHQFSTDVVSAAPAGTTIRNTHHRAKSFAQNP